MKKTILITGSNGKIGRILCNYFLANDDIVVAIVSNRQSEDDLRQYLNSHVNINNLCIIVADLTVNESAHEIIKSVKNTKIQIDSIIHAARNRSFLHVSNQGVTSNACFINEFNLGVVSPYQLTMQLAQKTGQKLTSVVMLSSMYGVVAFNRGLYKEPDLETPIQYSVVKSSQIHLVKELAVRLAPKTRVNSVAFGGVEGRADVEFIDKYSKLCPMGRMLQEEEIIGPIEFLLSEKSSSITGHNLIADGGWTTW